MYTYSYDADGNRTKEDHYYFTVGELCESAFRRGYTYTYTSDRLMQRTYRSISGTGATTSCTYDQMGNPKTYLDKTLTWARGRLLASYGNTTFRYNGEGIRFKKDNIEYILDGERIIAEKENGVITKRYFYDGTGIAGMEYNGKKYTFCKNIQGDVIAIFEGDTKVASYTYDAWGRILSSSGSMVSVNPFRYRGYYYDNETGLYYLNSRYYDPATGRFLNPDTYSYLDPETLNGLNLYVYALNNPIMYCDPSGHWVISLLIGIGLGALFGALGATVTGLFSGLTGWGLLGHIASGTLMGAVLGGATTLGGLFGIGAIAAKATIGIKAVAVIGGLLASVGASFGAGLLSYSIEQWSKDEDIDLDEMFSRGGIAATQGLFAFGVGAMMGAAGCWDSLNKGQWKQFRKSFLSAGKSSFKSFIKATGQYLQKNIGQIVLRNIYKSALVSSWGFLKMAL